MKGKVKKERKIHKKGTILAVSIMGLLVVVGGTIAYHTSRGTFIGLFHLGYWSNETTDDIPTDASISTCDETPKTVIPHNTGNVTATVRMKYDEYWRTAGSTTQGTTSDLALTDGNNQKYAYTNIQNEDLWELRSDGWYYYKYNLAPGKKAKSLLKSVTLNCDMNFAGANTNCTTEGNTRSCTKQDNPYDSATFHVFVTVQYIQSDACQDAWGQCSEDPHIPNCENNELFDHMSCISEGLDTNVNFRSSSPAVEGSGVKTLEAHSEDNYPVYYYRGSANVNNHVIFAGYCWRIMRTTSTGGVKIFYNGTPSNGQCIDTYSTNPGSDYAVAKVNNNVTFHYSDAVYNGAHYAPHLGGYMYVNLPTTGQSLNQRLTSADVSWDGEKYTLIEPITTSNYDYKRRYYCPDKVSSTCTTVAFALDYTYSYHNGYILSGGDKYPDAVHKNFRGKHRAG